MAKTRELTKEIYLISKQGAFFQDFGLRNQIRQASVSVMSNIAEGLERDGSGDFYQFLSIAKGSRGEVKSQLYIAADQEYLDKETFDRLFQLASETGKMTKGFMSYLRRSSLKGTKYKQNASNKKGSASKPETRDSRLETRNPKLETRN